VGYGVLRHLSPDAALRERLAAAPWPEVSFNFLGRLGDGPADPLAERTGPARAAAGERAHLIELNGSVTAGRLQFDVFFSGAIHDEVTARTLADALGDELRALATTVGADGVSAHDLETVLRRVRETSA
jgi:non-ribosomal peptide synthase protein (TIGR01720 family)